MSYFGKHFIIRGCPKGVMKCYFINSFWEENFICERGAPAY